MTNMEIWDFIDIPRVRHPEGYVLTNFSNEDSEKYQKAMMASFGEGGKIWISMDAYDVNGNKIPGHSALLTTFGKPDCSRFWKEFDKIKTNQ